MARLLTFCVLVCFSISHIWAQSPQTYVLEKPGTLKKMMKGNEGVTNLSISGIFNEKDLIYIASLQNLRVLDIRKAKLSPKAKLGKLIVNENYIMLDTLKCPDGTEFNYGRKLSDGKDCFYSYHSIIYPRYFVVGNNTQVNFYKECPNNDYSGINIFPNTRSTENQLKLSGTLYLKDAISIGDYFCHTWINRIVFSPKIKKIERHAFFWCHYLVDVVFEDGADVDIEEDAFRWENERTCLKRIRVPYGQIQKFVSMGFPRDILIDKTSDIKMEVEVKTPGSLAEQLNKVDLRLIQSLKIKGILNSDDFFVINKMISLEKLDLKDAVTFVPVAEKKADNALVASLLGIANEGQYQKDGNVLDYKMRSKLIKLGKDGYDQTITCELPRNAFEGNPLLECIHLPATLNKINRAGIGGSEGFTLSKLNRLKEIWISKMSDENIYIKKIVKDSKVQIRYY